MAFKRIPLGSETGGWGGESSRYGRVTRLGGLSTGGLRYATSSRMRWPGACLLPAGHPHSSQATWQPWSRAPHGPGATALSGHPHSSGRQCGRGSQQIVQGSFEGEGRGVSPVGMPEPRVARPILSVYAYLSYKMYVDYHHEPSMLIFNEIFFAFLMPIRINYPVICACGRACSGDA